MFDTCQIYQQEGSLLNLTFQPNGILLEPTKKEFLEIVNDFIKLHIKEYQQFCKMGVAE